MKRTINQYTFSAIASAALLFAPACGDKLEIEPVSFVSEETALGNSANVVAALDGTYDMASVGGLYGGQALLISELLADDGDIRWRGTFNDPLEVYNKSLKLRSHH